MIIIRRRLFSKGGEEKKKDKNKTPGLKTAVLGLAGTNFYLNSRDPRPKGKGLKAEDAVIHDRVLAKHRGNTKILEPTPEQEEALKEKVRKEYEKRGKTPPKNIEIRSSHSPSKNTIMIVSKDKSATTLAHELGHRDFYRSEGKNVSKLGKASHRAAGILSHPGPKAAIGTTAAYGSLVSGVRDAHRKRSGKEDDESKIERYGADALVTAKNIPTLHREYAASRRAMKMLKEAGASKALRGNARKELMLAGGTYLSSAGLDVAKQELFRKGVSKVEGKRLDWVEKRKNKKSKDKK